MPTLISNLLKCFAAGVFIVLVYRNLAGYTVAIAVPAEFFAWFREKDIPVIGMMVWDIFIVQLPAVGVISAVLTFIVVRNSAFSWLKTALLIILSIYMYWFLVGPLVDGNEINYIQSFSKYLSIDLMYRSFEIVLFSSILSSAYLAMRLKKERNTNADKDT